MSVIESEDYDEFVTSTIVHDVDKCTRLRLCGAARLDFDDIHDTYFEGALEIQVLAVR